LNCNRHDASYVELVALIYVDYYESATIN
jgi:hypothetical protein